MNSRTFIANNTGPTLNLAIEEALLLNNGGPPAIV